MVRVGDVPALGARQLAGCYGRPRDVTVDQAGYGTVQLTRCAIR